MNDNPHIPDPGRHLSSEDRQFLRELEASRPWLEGIKEIGSWLVWMMVGFALGLFFLGPFLGTLFSFFFSIATRWTFHHIMSGFKR
jgi:hypothetical protein